MPESTSVMKLPSALLFVTWFTQVHSKTPEDNCNWQNEYCCSQETLIARPRNVQDIQSVVRKYKYVEPNGVGHSWNDKQFCANLSPSNQSMKSVNIALAAVQDNDIHIDERGMTVTVAAWVKIRYLLDYLASYGEKGGYSLPTFPWFIDQTIGGAVATGTHGSSIMHGSLSSEDVLLELEMILANGTKLSLSSATYPFLMKAARVSVGRLGIITALKFRILPQKLYRRTVESISHTQLATDLLMAQRNFLLTNRIIHSLQEGTQYLWFIPTQEVLRISIQERDLQVLSSARRLDPSNQALEQTPRNAEELVSNWTLPTSNRSFWAVGPLPRWLVRLFSSAVQTLLRNGPLQPGESISTRDAIISQSEELTRSRVFFGGFSFQEAVFDQYEVGIPFATAGSCLAGLIDLVEEDEQRYAFRTPALIRIVRQEDAFLSISSNSHVVYINLEDYVSFNQRPRERNQGFLNVIHYLRHSDRCIGSRIHWGKAGWPEEGCWDGSREYPETWCDFGCAVHELDPTAKFSSSSTIWNWEGANLQSCCTPNGFKHEDSACKCQVLDRTTRRPICEPSP